MANHTTLLVMKNCVVCDTPFVVCPPGKTSRRCQRSYDAEYCSRDCRHKARWRQGTPCKKLSDTDAAYIAGFFDGEGSVIIYKRNRNCALRVIFSNTKIHALEWIRDTIGAGNITQHVRASDKWATSHMLLVNSQAAQSVLEQLRPYLHIKGPQADIAIHFQQSLKNPKLKSDISWQFEAREKVMALNKRGPILLQ